MLKICLSVFALQLFYMMVYIEIVKTWLYGHVFYAHGRPEEKSEENCYNFMSHCERFLEGNMLLWKNSMAVAGTAYDSYMEVWK